MKPRAFLFDMNGTMINDMHHHEKAWFDILNDDLNANMTMEQVKGHMYGKNEELFERVFGKDFYSMDDVAAYSLKKEQRYQEDFLPHLKLIDGLEKFLSRARAHNIPMAIGTAASPFNVDYVLSHIPIKNYFDAIVTADDVAVSKPDPAVFVKCADDLGVAYDRCIVFEDSPKGVEAASRAGMKAVVLKTYHAEHEFAHLDNILMLVDDYNEERLNALFA
jgi:HAD superfamily hydrolase (TIGR01509 family)